MNVSSGADRPLLTAARAALKPFTNTLLIVGVSGGPDSLCLLHLLTRIAPRAGVGLHVAHLDHRLRPESPEDARFVETIAGEWRLPVTVERRRPVKPSEQAARNTRYAFFSDVAKATNGAAVAVGHTADDQVETVLLHLIRGSGLTGLAGMFPDTELNGLRVIRPLLPIRRAQTLAYCERHGIASRDDASNRSPTFTRNRIRLEVLPLLRQLNPRVDAAVLRLAQAAQDEADFWRWFLAQDRLGSLPRAAQVRRLQEAHPTLEASHINSLIAGKRTDLPGKVRAEPRRGELTIRTLEKTPPWSATLLAVPGETLAGPWKVTCTAVTKPHSFSSEDLPRLREPQPTPPGFGCLLPVSSGPLTLRPRRPGDRYRPTGMPAAKKLQDILVDAKVPRYLRDLVPVLEDPSGILWAGAHRIAEEAKLKDDADTALEVRLEPMTDPARELTRLYT